MRRACPGIFIAPCQRHFAAFVDLSPPVELFEVIQQVSESPVVPWRLEVCRRFVIAHPCRLSKMIFDRFRSLNNLTQVEDVPSIPYDAVFDSTKKFLIARYQS